jgi:hypothetical protein
MLFWRQGAKNRLVSRPSIGEIKGCELAMMPPGCLIISAGGTNLIIEIAERFGLAFYSYPRTPFVFSFVPGHAPVF